MDIYTLQIGHLLRVINVGGVQFIKTLALWKPTPGSTFT